MRRTALLVPALVLLVLGCSGPRAVPIIGPDGSRMFHVSCGNHEAECYLLAGERCPYGYDVGRTIAGAGNMLVRCHVPEAEPAYPTARYASPEAAPTEPYIAPARPSPPALPALRSATPAPSASTPVPSASAAPRPPPGPVVPNRPDNDNVDYGF